MGPKTLLKDGFSIEPESRKVHFTPITYIGHVQEEQGSGEGRRDLERREANSLL